MIYNLSYRSCNPIYNLSGPYTWLTWLTRVEQGDIPLLGCRGLTMPQWDVAWGCFHRNWDVC